jgi:hypothetical protein
MKKELDIHELIDFSNKMGWDATDIYWNLEIYFKEKFYIDSCNAKIAPKDKVFNLITFRFGCDISPDRKGDIGICYDNYCVFTGVYWETQDENKIPLETIIRLAKPEKCFGMRNILDKYYSWQYDITEAIDLI